MSRCGRVWGCRSTAAVIYFAVRETIMESVAFAFQVRGQQRETLVWTQYS